MTELRVADRALSGDDKPFFLSINTLRMCADRGDEMKNEIFKKHAPHDFGVLQARKSLFLFIMVC